jgi:FemAB-related protein (PEP-CTERM system-associated)
VIGGAPGGAAVSIRLAEPRDQAQVDAWVRARPDGTPFHTLAWTAAVAHGCRQHDASLIAEHRDGSIAGVLPLVRLSSPLFGTALISSAFGTAGGILAETPSAEAGLRDRAGEEASTLGCASIELRGGPDPGAGWTADSATYLGFSGPLAECDDAQLLAIPRKQRAEIRKALGARLKVTTGRGAADRAAHYAVYAESVRNLGTPVFPRRLFDAVLDGFPGESDILTVWLDGRPISSVLTLYWAGRAMPYWGGGTRAARAVRSNELMYYALMCHARANQACRVFDFGRSKAGTGAAAFKRNWGFAGTPLTYFACSLDGGPLRDINPLSPRYRLQIALWKRLPLALANAIGPLISRGLG